MVAEIFVENQKLDLTQDLQSLITFALDDVKDFSARSTTFSKTVVLPGTARNNAIFGNIFETGIANDYDSTLPNSGFNFNAAKSARVIIFQDNIQTFKGTLRMLEIDIFKGRIEYEVALNGELTGLNVALSAAKLTDLDFSAYDCDYLETVIAASWDANFSAPGSGVYFPLVDYGNYSTLKHDWDILTFRPALYAKEYIDKMFAAADFTYSSAVFNTDRFKRLVIPHNQKRLQSLTSLALSAQKVSSQTVINYGTSQFTTIGTWDGFVGGGFSYVGGRFTYTAATTLTTNFSWRIGGFRYSSVPGSFRIDLRKNGVAIASTTISTFNFTVNYNWQSTLAGITIVTGDIFDFQWNFISGNNMLVTFLDNPATFEIDSTVPTLLPISYGQRVTVNDAIPQNIRQVDFLLGIVKLFNLYVWEDQFEERKIYIEPFINFYSGAVVDWTYKMNRDSAIKFRPMSELTAKVYNFKYANDSDYWNEIYNKRYNIPYGSQIFDTQFEFASQTNDLQIIFAPTPLVGYEGEDKIYPTIFKRTGQDAAPVEENVDSVIRILQSKKVMGVSSWSIKTGLTVRGSYLNYGYAGHFNDPDNPSNDLNFGVLQELFFELVTGDLTHTQFNDYWSAYMSEITNKDSRMLVAKFYLTARDIFNLTFASYILVDGVLFRLNKIKDYNATQPGDCEVELLRAINANYTYPPIPPVETFYWIDSDNGFVLDSDNSKIPTQ